MILAKILLAMFPASFQRRYGAEWESVVEEILHAAQQKGVLATAGAWLGLVMDTAERASLAHARQWWVASVGTAPVLAGMGPGQATLALGEHWLRRPLMAGLRITRREGHFFWAGMGAALGLYLYLEYRASQVIAGQMADPSLVEAAQPQWQLRVALVALTVVALATHRAPRWWNQWKRTGFPIASPLLVFGLGAMVGLHLLLLLTLNTLGMQAMEPFNAFQWHRKAALAMPTTTDTSTWTATQNTWFRVEDAQGAMARVALRPAYQARWCEQRMAGLQAERIAIQSNLYASPAVGALLWNGSVAVAGGHGCTPWSEVLRQHQIMAAWAQAHPGLFQLTWEPLTFLPSVDYVVAGHHLTMPLVQPRYYPYCMSMAGTMAREAGVVYEADRIHAFCVRHETQWNAEWTRLHPLQGPRWWQRAKWRLGLDLTGQGRWVAERAPRLTQSDLAGIEAQLRVHSDQWAGRAEKQ